MCRRLALLQPWSGKGVFDSTHAHAGSMTRQATWQIYAKQTAVALCMKQPALRMLATGPW